MQEITLVSFASSFTQKGKLMGKFTIHLTTQTSGGKLMSKHCQIRILDPETNFLEDFEIICAGDTGISSMLIWVDPIISLGFEHDPE